MFSFLFVTSVQIGTHKFTDKLTSLHTNSEDNIGFDVGKCAAQLLYGLVLVIKLYDKYSFSSLSQTDYIKKIEILYQTFVADDILLANSL